VADALEVRLRDVIDADPPVSFEQQRAPAAFHVAASTAKDPDDRAASDVHGARLRATVSARGTSPA
jgi:hypothetical protein